MNKTIKMLSSVEHSIGEHVTTHDILIKVFGHFGKDVIKERRTVQKCLNQLINEGKVGRIKVNKKTYGYFAIGPRLVDDIFDTCVICQGLKNSKDLDEDGICEICRDLATQVTAAPNPHITTTDKRIARAFGNPDDCEDNEAPGCVQLKPSDVKNGRKKDDVMKMLVSQKIRVVLPGGRLIHGVLNEVTNDGFLGVQTDHGPSVINPKHIASLQIWNDNLEKEYQSTNK